MSEGLNDTFREKMAELGGKLEGQRYGAVVESVAAAAREGEPRLADVWEWLKAEMDS